MAEQVSNAFKYGLLGAMILSGAANTIVYNTQNSTVVELKGVNYQFNHPFMQAMSMFIGEFSCYLAFLIVCKSTVERREKYDEIKEREMAAKGISNSKKKLLLLVIPASSDFMTSTLQYIALNYINPSIYQMMRGGVILVTALFSRFFLGKKLKKYMLLGCALVFIGIGLVGSSNFAFPQKEKDDGEDDSDQPPAAAQGIALLMIVISLFFNGCLFISEEWLFGKYFLHPFQVVGTEGFWGIILYSIAMPIVSNIHCNCEKLKSACVVYPASRKSDTDHDIDYNTKYSKDHSYFESPALFFQQCGHDAFLSIMVFFGVLTIAVFNVCGVNVTKHISALTRSIADVSRTLLVWGVSLIITVTAGKDKSTFEWENTRWEAILLELSGFLILVFGNFVYNGILRFKFLDYSNLENPEQSEQDIEDGLIEKDLSMQPQAIHEDDDQDYNQQNSGNKGLKRQKRSFAKDSFHN